MGDGEAAELELGEQRLHVAQHGAAGRGIAHMADGEVARKPTDDVLGTEVVADQAERAVGVELLAVEGDDPRRLLTPVLQGVQAEGRVGGGIGASEDAEDTAFLVQAVVVVGAGRYHGGGASFHRLLSIRRSMSWRWPRP